jgi:ABC-type amino acid transport substrate-binding protein
MASTKSVQAALIMSVLALLAAIIAGVAGWSKGSSNTANPDATTPGLLQRIEASGELHAGYGVYPPYTIEDAASGRVSGFSVDVINEIAKQLNCTVVWHRMNWNTMSADLKRGQFDVIADPIFQTVPRAREFAFTEPYAYFADGIAVVRVGEQRFTDFDSLDRGEVTIAVGQGWASETLLTARFTKAKIVPIQTGTDLLQVFNEVLAGRADVAVADAADAVRFVEEHSGEVKALFVNNPPAYMPAGFALRPTDQEGADFLTVCLRNLEATGVLDALAKKYNVPSRATLPSGD